MKQLQHPPALKELLRECDLSQKLLVERVISIVQDSLNDVYEQKKRNEDEEEWLTFMKKDFMKTFITKEYVGSHYNYDNWLHYVRLEFKAKKENEKY